MVDLSPYQSKIIAAKTYNESHNHPDDFIRYMVDLGYTAPRSLKYNTIDRIDAPDDKRGKKSGWYIFNQHESVSIGTFGSWKTDEKHTWTSKHIDSMTFAQKVKINQSIKENEIKHKQETQEQHNRVAIEAAKEWQELPDATNDNPYLIKKGIRAVDGLKARGDILIMPITLDGKITSYQKIMPNSDKRMKTGGRVKGCYFEIKGDSGTVYIAEGLATGISAHEATGNHVYIAISSNNLYEVSRHVKKQHEKAHIVLLGENNDTNKQKCAQIDLHAIFPPNADHDDFNDMHVADGIDAVRDILLPKIPPQKQTIEKENNYDFKFGGVLDEIIDYYNATSGNDQPLFAVQTALGICSVLLGRNFISNLSNKTALFLLNLAKSATGKEHAKKVIEKILEATDNDQLINGEGYTSGTAVISALQMRPRHITIIDEVSKNLEAANNKNSNGMSKEANTKLMEVIGRLDGTIRARAYATIGLSEAKKKELANQYVVNPSITYLGMSTPDDFFNNVGQVAIKDGFINRFIVCISDAERTLRQHKPPVDVPDVIIEWDQIIKKRHNNALEVATEKPNEVLISFTMDALAEQEKFQQKCIDLANNLESFNMEEITGRSNEMAMRIAMIIALSENPNTSTIEQKHVKLAIKWVDFNLQRLIKNLKVSVSGSEFEASKKEILKALRKKPISRTDMHKRSPYAKYKTKDLNEILSALYESELAIATENKTKGRTGTLWTAL